ncbi:hypothetical protein WICPIJ_009512 [Wickerhamomyces pijperi]|uniref:C2H2-type domain-containing protein n=1 Tax=Wickerhamomyces pijperi TaxID=599730 RepID=A0A9P8TDB6_WICPI|nr:hypothetical protein WICPIJ_009512 [Wickerhamomyces pijperi]
MGFTTGSIPFHSQPLVQERSQSFSHYPDIANLARPLPPLSYQTPAVSGFPVVSSPGISYPPLPSNTVRSPLLATAQQHQQTMYNNSPVNHKQQFHIQHPSYTNSPYQPQPQQQHNHHRHQLQVYQPHQPTPTEPAYPKFNRVLPVSQISKPKRQRRKAHEMLRLYACTYPQCSSSYGTLNHLNAHIQIKKHGNKRRPEEFKELREVLKNGQMEKWSQAEILKWVADVQRTQRQGGMG